MSANATPESEQAIKPAEIATARVPNWKLPAVDQENAYFFGRPPVPSAMKFASGVVVPEPENLGDGLQTVLDLGYAITTELKPVAGYPRNYWIMEERCFDIRIAGDQSWPSIEFSSNVAGELVSEALQRKYTAYGQEIGALLLGKTITGIFASGVLKYLTLEFSDGSAVRIDAGEIQYGGGENTWYYSMLLIDQAKKAGSA